jgi:hypothetical protein
MEPGTRYLKRLTNEEHNQAHELLSHLVKSPMSDRVRVVLIKKKDWLAVPIAVEEMFNLKAIEGFVKAAQFYGRSEVIATWIDQNPDSQIDPSLPPVTYSVPAILEGVQELHLGPDLMLTNCAVFAGNPDWVYIREVDDLDVIYGPETITRMFTNMSVDEAFKAFGAWFAPRPQRMREAFNKFCGDLRHFNSFPPGVEIDIF